MRLLIGIGLLVSATLSIAKAEQSWVQFEEYTDPHEIHARCTQIFDEQYRLKGQLYRQDDDAFMDAFLRLYERCLEGKSTM